MAFIPVSGWIESLMLILELGTVDFRLLTLGKAALELSLERLMRLTPERRSSCLEVSFPD